MKFLLRIFGTWFLGLALVMIVVDGAKTLASNTVTTTSFAEMWQSLHEASWLAVSTAVTGFFAAFSSEGLAEAVFDWPGWVIFGLTGLVFLVLGRQTLARRYIRTY